MHRVQDGKDMVVGAARVYTVALPGPKWKSLLYGLLDYLDCPLRGATLAGNVDMLKAVPHIGLNGSFNEAARTEDVKFSPSGRVLAVVATNGVISLLAVDTCSRPVQIGQYAELHSTSLSSPHGIDFLSEDVVVVANRSGWSRSIAFPA